jgi:hypothetical protein
MANEKYMPWTVVIDVFLLLFWPPFKKNIFRSPHSLTLGGDQMISNDAGC